MITDEDLAASAAQRNKQKKEKTPCLGCANAQFMRLDPGNDILKLTSGGEWHEYDGMALRICCNHWREYVQYPEKITSCDGFKNI